MRTTFAGWRITGELARGALRNRREVLDLPVINHLFRIV